MIIVDKNRCKQCNACIAECPNGVAITKGSDGYPKSGDDFEERCINCFHCTAVCRNHALSFSDRSWEDSAPLNKELSINLEQAEQFLKTRRSFRSFKKKPVPRETLSRVMNISRWAPTASNQQPLEWVLVESPEKTREMAQYVIDCFRQQNIMQPLIEAWDAGYDMILRGAPHLAIAHADSEYAWGPHDSSIALTYLELAANAHKIGSCWAGYLTKAAADYPLIKESLGIPETNTIFAALMLGNPKYKFHSVPERKELKLKWI